jgi:hypothetical protein
MTATLFRTSRIKVRKNNNFNSNTGANTKDRKMTGIQDT